MPNKRKHLQFLGEHSPAMSTVEELTFLVWDAKYVSPSVEDNLDDCTV